MNINEPKVFTQRLDFYGKSLAAYVFVAVIFVVVKLTLVGTSMKIEISPILMIMIAIILITAFMLLVAAIKRKTIIFDNDKIIFRSRFYNKSILYSDILYLKINNSPTRFVKNDASFVRLKIKGRKKFILLRTASFNEDEELLSLFKQLRKELKNKN